MVVEMIIPYQELSQEALFGLVKDYVISQVSDTEVDMDIDIWVQKVVGLLKKKELLIEYSEVDETVMIKRKEDMLKGSLE
ncbi:MAG: hypothetical protein COW84_09385 [Gammaproteobacteria bacterium CG22_combo_CG10-13_8_21_14_all_40_8]|nr:MAG: hypothetical protein COW84_09385 [Gammaproteobacteria bacterium CG22_combo_CG10-13_8_21_14_all_40_8]